MIKNTPKNVHAQAVAAMQNHPQLIQRLTEDPAPPAPIPTAILTINEQIEGLGVALDLLEKRLAGVLVEIPGEKPCATSDDINPEAGSRLGSDLVGIAQRVSSFTKRVNTLMQRLEI